MSEDFEWEYQETEDDYEEYVRQLLDNEGYADGNYDGEDYDDYVDGFDYVFPPVTRWQHIQIWFWGIVWHLRRYVKRCPKCHNLEKFCQCYGIFRSENRHQKPPCSNRGVTAHFANVNIIESMG